MPAPLQGRGTLDCPQVPRCDADRPLVTPTPGTGSDPSPRHPVTHQDTRGPIFILVTSYLQQTPQRIGTLKTALSNRTFCNNEHIVTCTANEAASGHM